MKEYIIVMMPAVDADGVSTLDLKKLRARLGNPDKMTLIQTEGYIGLADTLAVNKALEKTCERIAGAPLNEELRYWWKDLREYIAAETQYQKKGDVLGCSTCWLEQTENN